MLFTYTGPGTVNIPALDLTVSKGEEFEATGDVAKGLLDQDAFTRTDKPATKKEN